MNGNQADLKISNVDFNDLYQNAHIQLALADLISENQEDKPIIAAHPYGCNNISALPKALLSEGDRKKLNEGLKKNGEEISLEVREKCAELSKTAIKKEFNAIFALVEAQKRPVSYIRWMPKSDELLMASRNNHKGHFVCLHFFLNSNSDRSILIANPNGKAISDEHEAAAINSYLEKNPVKIYQSRDYFQFRDTDCGPGTAAFVRMIHGMSQGDFNSVIQKGQQEKQGEESPFDYVSIEFGNDALQREIGVIPQKNTEEEKKIGQKLRHADYVTAKACKEHNTIISNNSCAALALKGIPFNEKLTEGLSNDQVQLLNNTLLSGKKLLEPEQIQQVKQSREKLLKGKNTTQNQNSKAINNGCISSSDESIETLNTEIVNDDKSKNLLQKLNSCLTLLIAICISGIILPSILLSISNSVMNIGKMINIAIIATSSIILTCTVSVICIVRNKEAKVGANIDDLTMHNLSSNPQQNKGYGSCS